MLLLKELTPSSYWPFARPIQNAVENQVATKGLLLSGYIYPQIYNENKRNPSTLYQVFQKNGSKVPIEYEKEDWFILNVKVLGDKITLINKKNTLFRYRYE